MGTWRGTLLLAIVAFLLVTAGRAEAFIYYTTDNGSIGRASINGTGADPNFITGASDPCGLAVDSSYIYWTNAATGTIGRANLDGTHVTQSLIGGGDGTCGVSTLGNGQLFWANPGNGTIGDGFNDGTGVNQSLYGPSVTDDPFGTATAGVDVYWTNNDGDTISRGVLDGNSAQAILHAPDVQGPTGIAASADGLFWVNQDISWIGHSALDGSGATGTWVNVGPAGACGVAVDSTYIYWGGPGEIGRSLLNAASPNPNFANIGLAGTPCGLAVNADTPDGSASPSSLNLGGVLVSAGTASQAVTVTNSASTSVGLVLAAPGLLGPNADQYSITGSTCPGTLAPGGNCTVTVTFDPTSLGGKAAILTIPTNDPVGPLRAALFGTGTDPNETVAPASVAFGPRLVNTQSLTQTVTLTNEPTASAPDIIGQSAIAGTDASQFGIVADGCSNTNVAIGDGCQISVRFAPTSTGAASASLSIPSNDPTSPATVALSGTGTVPVESVSPGALAFASQAIGTSSATQKVTVANSAGATGPLVLGSVVRSGAGAVQYDIVFDSCSGASLSPGADCQLGVRFVPTTAGQATASLQIPSNSPGGTAGVALSGQGATAAAVPSKCKKKKKKKKHRKHKKKHCKKRKKGRK